MMIGTIIATISAVNMLRLLFSTNISIFRDISNSCMPVHHPSEGVGTVAPGAIAQTKSLIRHLLPFSQLHQEGQGY